MTRTAWDGRRIAFLERRFPWATSAPSRSLYRLVLLILQGYFGCLCWRSQSFAPRTSLVILILRCFERDTNPPGADISILFYLIRRWGPRAPVEFHGRGGRKQDIIEFDRVCCFCGAETDALSLVGGLKRSEVGRRHEALTTSEGLKWRGY